MNCLKQSTRPISGELYHLLLCCCDADGVNNVLCYEKRLFLLYWKANVCWGAMMKAELQKWCSYARGLERSSQWSPRYRIKYRRKIRDGGAPLCFHHRKRI